MPNKNDDVCASILLKIGSTILSYLCCIPPPPFFFFKSVFCLQCNHSCVFSVISVLLFYIASVASPFFFQLHI